LTDELKPALQKFFSVDAFSRLLVDTMMTDNGSHSLRSLDRFKVSAVRAADQPLFRRAVRLNSVVSNLSLSKRLFSPQSVFSPNQQERFRCHQ
jgi:hypothetical protein